jgi:hypothetical protein
MAFYLETNALRTLSSRLEDFYPNSFTSALAIVELVGGLKRDFHIRKKVIENLFKSNLEIQWKLPHSVIANSYSLNAFEENKISDLKKLCKILIESETLIEFQKNCLNQEIESAFEYFEKYKNVFSDNFIRSTTEGNIKIQELFNKRMERSFQNITVRYGLNKKPTLEMLQKEDIILNRSITVFAFAKMFADQIHKDKATESETTEIYKSFTGLVSYFIEAISFYTVDKMIQSSPPSKNDVNDLYHLVYLRNDPSLQLLTDDKLLLNLNEKLWDGKIRIKAITEKPLSINQELKDL